jgi:hypothetical protein
MRRLAGDRYALNLKLSMLMIITLVDPRKSSGCDCAPVVHSKASSRAGEATRSERPKQQCIFLISPERCRFSGRHHLSVYQSPKRGHAKLSLLASALLLDTAGWKRYKATCLSVSTRTHRGRWMVTRFSTMSVNLVRAAKTCSIHSINVGKFPRPHPTG